MAPARDSRIAEIACAARWPSKRGAEEPVCRLKRSGPEIGSRDAGGRNRWRARDEGRGVHVDSVGCASLLPRTALSLGLSAPSYGSMRGSGGGPTNDGAARRLGDSDWRHSACRRHRRRGGAEPVRKRSAGGERCAGRAATIRSDPLRGRPRQDRRHPRLHAGQSLPRGHRHAAGRVPAAAQGRR